MVVAVVRGTGRGLQRQSCSEQTVCVKTLKEVREQSPGEESLVLELRAQGASLESVFRE